MDVCGKSQELSEEPEEKFGFVGGRYQEHAEYFNKPMVQELWDWSDKGGVSAIAGFSGFANKSGKQRKLLMQCDTNCMWRPVRVSHSGAGKAAGCCSCLPRPHAAHH